ncbi:CDP-alcohol phosphatidyltransferase [Paenibacillus marchantiophytorum]|uniref:CDP-alcohol phosphatidyltransferase n=1 Tax=Paenibacillus marchantiophytorum TaxID=1619310 RepID=A0ABQ2BNA5_9BACL|nr:heme-binding protein [Paenibacillus marchantiophytorum]GGI43690.1 CDP-alcohol phosphatidyltransferase [Paenibacillus marchantiophytorum]
MKSVFKLELEEARVMIEAGVQAARTAGTAETICIVDDGGYLIALERMNGARNTSPDMAIAKAFTASGHRRSTHLFTQPGGPATIHGEAFGIHAMMPGKFAIFVGGIPIVVNGTVIGGVGVSGGNGEDDIAVGVAALKALQGHLGNSYTVLTEPDIKK